MINADKNQYLDGMDRFLIEYINNLRNYNSFQISIFNYKMHYYATKVIEKGKEFLFMKKINYN